MKTIIHVNQRIIKQNHKTGDNEPVLTVKTYKTNKYAHEVSILGPSKVVYSPSKPLSCGARVWIETESEVEIKDDVMRRSKAHRLVDALAKLNDLIEQGAEIPDVDWKVAKEHQVSLEDLMRAYDEQYH